MVDDGRLGRAGLVRGAALSLLAPGFLVIDAAQGIAREWAKDRLTPGTLQDMARQELVALAPLLRRLPRHADRLATIAERGDLRANVSLFRDAEDVRGVTRLVNRAVLAFLGGVVGAISVVLLGIDGGRPSRVTPRCTSSSATSGCFSAPSSFCESLWRRSVMA